MWMQNNAWSLNGWPVLWSISVRHDVDPTHLLMLGCLQDNQLLYFVAVDFRSDLPYHFNWWKFLQNHVSQTYFSNILRKKTNMLHASMPKANNVKWLFCVLHYGLDGCKHFKCNQWAICWNIRISSYQVTLLCVDPKLTDVHDVSDLPVLIHEILNMSAEIYQKCRYEFILTGMFPLRGNKFESGEVYNSKGFFS